MVDRREFLHAGMLGLATLALPPMAAAASGNRGGTAAFGWQGERFLLQGEPFVIRGGEMHLSRVPRAHWRARLRMLKAMGLNTVGTFLPQVMSGLDGKEVVTEVFGALGFKGAERFFPNLGGQENPVVLVI